MTYGLYVEAPPGIEPGYTNLQSVASPLRHGASQEAVYNQSKVDVQRENASQAGLRNCMEFMRQYGIARGRAAGL